MGLYQTRYSATYFNMIVDLWAVEGENRVKDDIVHSCCGKVGVTDNKIRQSVIGYILEKEDNKWKDKIANNIEILITPAVFVCHKKRYRLQVEYSEED